MMKLSLNAKDFQFQSDNALYVYDLDRFALVKFTYYANGPCELQLLGEHDHELLTLHCDASGSFQIRADHWSQIILRPASKATSVAIECLASGTDTPGEQLDPTPVAMTTALKREPSMQDMINLAVMRQMAIAQGAQAPDPDDIDISPLDGDFTDEDEHQIPQPFLDEFYEEPSDDVPSTATPSAGGTTEDVADKPEGPEGTDDDEDYVQPKG